MTPLYGSDMWLMLKIRPATELQIRRELRALVRAADAMFTCVWIPNEHEKVLAYAGDFAAMPYRMPDLESTVPSYEEVQNRLGPRQHAVVQQLVLGQRIVKLALAVVGPGMAAGPALCDLVERSADTIEGIVVDAIS